MTTNDGPQLYVKHVDPHPFSWWTCGKLYPVKDNHFTDNDGSRYLCSTAVAQPERFKLVWLLPDGTELEVLE